MLAALGGGLLALVPLAASAQEGSRALDPPDDWGLVMLVTALAVLGLGLLYTIALLYRRTRGLEWEFQQPDPPAAHDEHH